MFKNSTEKRRKYYEEVVRLYNEEGYGRNRIAKILPIARTTVGLWIANFVADNEKKYPQNMKKGDEEKQTTEDQMAAYKRRIAELESQLKYQEMRAEAYDTMINIAEKKFGIPVRKKSGAKR